MPTDEDMSADDEDLERQSSLFNERVGPLYSVGSVARLLNRTEEDVGPSPRSTYPRRPAMTASSEGSAEWYARIGPWVTPKAVAEYCNLSEQEVLQWTESGRLLGVEFADGKYYYQSAQFKDGGPVVGLDRVLAVLAQAFRAPATMAGWFSGPAYIGMDITRWDLLRLGDVKLVLDLAQDAVDWVNRR